MTIKVGTIHEMTGKGYEILVDVETRSQVLAQFYDGRFMESQPTLTAAQSGERTLVQ